MQVPITRRLMQGFGANVYGQTVNVCAQLLGVPILLHFWGVQLYGEWLILSAIPVYLSMTDLGFAQSAGNDMTQRVARGDLKGAIAVFQSIGALIALCSLAGLAVVVAVLVFTSFPDMLPVQLLSPREAAWVIGLLAADVLILINEGTVHAGFRASGGYALHTVLDNTARLIQYTALWISAAAGGGAVAGATAFLLVRLIVMPLGAILLVRKYPWIAIGVSHARWKDFGRLFRPAVANLALPFAQSLNIQGMRIVVGAAIGPMAVVSFTTLRTLARLILQASATIGHAAEPEIAAAFGSGNTFLLRTLYVRTTQLSVVLVTGLAVILYAAGDWVLAFWTDGKIAMAPWLFGWLLASTVASTFWSVSLIVIKAANHHLRAALFFMTAAGSAVALAYSMLAVYGRLSDAGFVLLFMDIAIAAYVVPIAGRLAGGGLRSF